MKEEKNERELLEEILSTIKAIYLFQAINVGILIGYMIKTGI